MSRLDAFGRMLNERFGWRLDETDVERLATYFFRGPAQFAALEEIVLPAAAASRSRPIRILSAGCATGEEPYSIAISALRALRPLPPIEILGVDLSPRAVERARANRYVPWTLRDTPEDVRRDYFESIEDEFAVIRAAAATVRFAEWDLLAGGCPPGPWDVVFFRNISMFFTPDAACDVVADFAANMPSGAHLFLGLSENLRGRSNAFVLRHTHGAFYYERRADAAIPPERGDDRSGGSVTKSPPDVEDDALHAAIVALGDGRFADARAAAGRALARDGTDAGAHYVLALCDEHAGDTPAAVSHDEMAIHLDPMFSMPHLHLGVMARTRADAEAARAHMRMARQLLMREDGSRPLFFRGAVDRDALLALCDDARRRPRE